MVYIALTSGMMFGMRGLQRRSIEMRVNLRGRQIGMPQHLLNRAQIGAALEKMGRESMAQQMRVELGFNPGPFA